MDGSEDEYSIAFVSAHAYEEFVQRNCDELRALIENELRKDPYPNGTTRFHKPDGPEAFFTFCIVDEFVYKISYVVLDTVRSVVVTATSIQHLPR